MVRPRTVLPVSADSIATCYLAGDTVAYLARVLGVDRSVVRRVLDEQEIEIRDDRGGHWNRRRTA